MPIIAGFIVGILYFVITLACRGPWGYGTLWPGHLAFAPLALLAEKINVPNLEFFAGPFLYPLYGCVLWYAARRGWARRALIELTILHYFCFAFLAPSLLQDVSIPVLISDGRVSAWQLGCALLIFIVVHLIAFRYATGRDVRKYFPAPRFSLRTMLAAIMLAGSLAALWQNRDAWSVQTRINAPEEKVQFMAFSADNQRVIGVFEDGTTRIWEIASGRELASHASHTAEKQSYADSPEGPIVAVLGPDDVQLPPSGPDIPPGIARTLQGKVTFEMVDTPLKEALAFACFRMQVPIEYSQRAKDQQLSETNVSLRVMDMERTLALSWLVKLADGEVQFRDSSIRVITRQESDEMERDNVRVWSLEDDTLLRSLETPGAQALVLSTDGRRLLAYDDFHPKTGSFLDVNTGKLLGTFTIKDLFVNSAAAAFSSDGTVAAIPGSDNGHYAILLFNLNRGAELKRLPQAGPIGKLAFSSDGTHLCAYADTNAGEPSLIAVSSGVKVGGLGGVFSPDGNLVFDSRYTKEAESGAIYRVDTGVIQARLHKYANARKAVFFPDSSRLLTEHYYRLTIWDSVDGSELATLPGLNYSLSSYLNFPSAVSPFAQSPPEALEPRISRDGNRILAEAEGNRLNVWQRLRPEWWWGYAWMPEFWLSLVFALGFVWSMSRDWRGMLEQKTPDLVEEQTSAAEVI